MPLQRLQLKDFRLFQEHSFAFTEGTNLILGKNGSGKTTVLELSLIHISEPTRPY